MTYPKGITITENKQSLATRYQSRATGYIPRLHGNIKLGKKKNKNMRVYIIKKGISEY